MTQSTIKAIQKLEGERIALIPLYEKDVNHTYLAWLNDPAVIQHIDARYHSQSLDSLKSFVSSFDQINGHIWRMVNTPTDTPIGNIQMRINWLHKTADIGILIGNSNFWGQGLAKEALNLVIQYAKSELQLEKVTMATRATNERMLKTIRSLGFFSEGNLKNQVIYENRRVDIAQYGLIFSE
ncbi:GNAT family N-acetyltransferase [Kiloniella litopenaei]|uniref:GNAT family N-acetyltransferase n=1 Tax=Kiloniella litopenaei TaxID=1549748 RepID=UPI003BAC2CC6